MNNNACFLHSPLPLLFPLFFLLSFILTVTSLFLFSSPSSHFNYNETERNGVKAWIKVNGSEKRTETPTAYEEWVSDERKKRVKREHHLISWFLSILSGTFSIVVSNILFCGLFCILSLFLLLIYNGMERSGM